MSTPAKTGAIRTARFALTGTLLLALSTLCLVACKRPVPLKFETASALPKKRDRPAGIAVDLSSSPMASQATAAADVGRVALRTPKSEAGALTTVRLFFRAILAHDAAALQRLQTSNARYHDVNNPSRVRNLRFTTRQRLRRFSYDQLHGQLVFDERNVKVYRGANVDSLPALYRPSRYALADYRRAADDGASWLVLRVPVLQTTVARQRVFGSELVFWLVPQDNAFRIMALYEDAPL